MRTPKVEMTQALADALKRGAEGHKYWDAYFQNLSGCKPMPFSVHLAVLVEPYLGYILDGSKTVESRFSKHRIAPYRRVGPGDVVLLKKAAAPSISGVCMVRQVWFYELDTSTWPEIRGRFSRALRADNPSFWDQRSEARYASLMRISDVHPTPAIEVPKRDRRGWAVLYDRTQSELGLSWEELA